MAARSDSPTANLPLRYAITGPAPSESAWRDAFESLVATQDVMIQIRAPELDSAALADRVGWARSVCAEGGVPLLLNGSIALVRELSLDGVHLNSAALGATMERPMSRARLVGASCHSPEELQQAERVGADFAVLSPVRAVESHPWAQPLGWDVFSEWASSTRVPVYALGGMRPSDLDQARSVGARGIAGISAFWRVA